jgi:hypothetical protein
MEKITADESRIRNFSTLEGAQHLATTIQQYWASFGFAVRTRVEAVVDHRSQDRTAYVVLSDLRNGRPK